MARLQQPFAALIELPLIGGGGALIAAALLPSGATGPLSILTGATLLAGLLYLLQRSEPLRTLVDQLRFTATAALATLLLLLISSLQPGNSGTLLLQTVALAVLMFAASGMVRLLYRLEFSHAGAVLMVIALLLLTASLPLWLGPLIERIAPNQPLVDALVAISPLSYLAAWDQWDYLRSGWFYRYSPIGSLRFDYPAPLLASACYVLLGLLPALFRRRLRRYSAISTPIHHSTGDPLR